MARTNIDIDDELITEVMRRHGFHTKREAVHAGLKLLAPSPMTRREAVGMKGYGWDGDLDSMRAGFGVDDE